MSQKTYEKIRANPKFRVMVETRGRFAVTLSLLVLVPYYSYMMVVAFFPSLLAQRLGDGAATVGFPIGAAIIILSWMLTGLYIRRANGEFDRMNQELLKEAQQ